MRQQDNHIKIPFTELIAASEELWHERKSLDWDSGPVGRKRTIARIEKKIAEIKTIIEQFPAEIEMLKKFYQ